MKINKRVKQLFFHSIIILLLIIAELIIITRFINPDVATKKFAIIIYFLAIAPLVFLYIIVVILYKLFSKYRMRRGGKFQARLIISFAIIAIIPLVPLIFLTSNLINQTIEIWLTKSIEEALDSGLNLVTNFLEEYKNDIKFYGKLLGNDKLIRYSIVFQSDSKMYKKGIALLIKKYKIDSIFVFDKNKNLLVELQYRALLKNFFDTGYFNETLKGKNIIELKKEKDIEYVIGYFPVYNDTKSEITGVLIITKILPANFSLQANKIASSLQAYKQMELYKKPIVKGITTIVVIIVALFVILVAIIISYFIAKGITEPIRILLEGTRNIAAGNLDFEIKYNAKDEIKILINAFNQMTRELRASKQALFHAQRIAAWRDIARKIAHEIKNPLTPIRLSAERLKKKYNSPDFEKILNKSVDTIIKEVDSLKTLVTEFSEFARMPQLNLNVENLNHIIIETLNMFEALSDIKIVTELEKDLPLLNLDKQRIKEVIVNLINNSIEALNGKKGAKIKIKTYSRTNVFGRFVYLNIEDNGPGMEKEVLDRIFDPYFTTKKEGTGLGLSIVEKIVTEHHGRIKCESIKGKGTKFIIEFNASA